MMKYAIFLALVAMCVAQKSSSTMKQVEWTESTKPLEIRSPLPVEVAHESEPSLRSERMEYPPDAMIYPSPALSASAPLVHLPKGAQEVVDVPHANIRLPGNSIQNKDLHLNLPTPVVEAPKPIFQEKEVLFRLPQPVFYIPKPIVQHKPIVYTVSHTLRTLTPEVNLREYLFKVPSAQITGKSSYSQPIPSSL